MTDSDRGVIGGRYQVIASLGKGGMGQVYKAYDPILDRTVALKKMIATVVDSEEGRQRFYIEARAAARLNHPNIVTIHELEEYGGDIYIVMELLDGVSLAAFMKQRVDMPLEGYLTIIAQIADGLHYAHKRAIVHRDIKPPNLVLTPSGNLKILDFGIARLASNEITRKGKLLGTPHYMAPEQVKEETVDARADLFSLGAVAYELVTGIKPFSGDSVPALLMQITSTPHRPVLEVAPDTEPALAAIIDRLLAKDREQRFATGLELCAALDLIGEIDRVDYVADGVAAVMGPSGEATIYAPIGSTPISAGTATPPVHAAPVTPATPTAAPSDLPPPFGATPSMPVGAPLTTMPSADDITPPFGITPSAIPPPAAPRPDFPPNVSFVSVTPKVAPLPKTSPEDATVSLSAPAAARVPSTSEAPPAPAVPAAGITPAASTVLPAAPISVSPATATAAPQTPATDVPASSDAPTLVDLQPWPTPEASPRSATLDTMVGAPASPPPAPPAIPPVPVPPLDAPSTAAAAKPPAATPSIVPPPPVGAGGVSGATPPTSVHAAAPPLGVPATPASPALPRVPVPPLDAPSAAATAKPPAAGPSIVPPTPAVAAGASSVTPPASAPRGFVNPGVPQAKHRSGMGAAVIVIGLLLLPAVIATGWWAFNSVRGALQNGSTATNTTSPSTTKDAPKPADQQAATTDQPNASQANQANANQTDPNQAKPGETPGQAQPTQTPTVDANAANPPATSTEKPVESQPPTRPAEVSPAQTANASQTSPPNPPPANPPTNQTPANQANATQTPPPVANRSTLPTQPQQTPANQVADARRTTPPANQANANTPPTDAPRSNVAPPREARVEPVRDAVTDRTREVSPETVVRDPSRENTRRGTPDTPREPQPPQRDTVADNTRRDPPPTREEPSREPSTPADTRALDYGSLSAFRGGSRGTGSASNVYSDSPSTAAAVARITYTLDAYGDAIAARDLDALRDVRSPVTPAEATMLKEGRLTVRFSNLDVSLDGNDARVRCRRAVVANGKTLSSGPADVRLTRRPEGWVITDIR